jgi:hypothetical protein
MPRKKKAQARRARFKAVAAVASAAMAVVASGPSAAKDRNMRGRKQAAGLIWSAFSSLLDNVEYHEAFRCDRGTLEEIMPRIGGYLQVPASKERMGLNASGHIISAHQRFAVFLRWAAGGQRVRWPKRPPHHPGCAQSPPSSRHLYVCRGFLLLLSSAQRPKADGFTPSPPPTARASAPG